jgi:hypothetical protein
MSTETQLTAENPMRAARTVVAYVIIAHYNIAKEREVNAGEHEKAREAAERLFPYENPKSLQGLAGVRTIHTFHSVFFDRLPDNFYTLSEQQQNEIAIPLIAELGDNLKIGWMAVVDASSYQSFVDQIGGEAGPLQRIYDIEVIPLNDDGTTNDIYQLMTPVSWNH